MKYLNLFNRFVNCQPGSNLRNFFSGLPVHFMVEYHALYILPLLTS